MAAYDLVLAKMKPVGAAPLQALGSAKVSKKKRKQPEPDAVPAAIIADKLHIDQVADKLSSKKEKKTKKTKAAAAAFAEASTESQNESVAQTAVAQPAVVQVMTTQQPHRARGRHVGRYHKTTAAKKAGSYSKSDLAAILGVDSFPTAAPVALAAAQASSSDEQVSTWVLTSHMLRCIAQH